MRDGRPKLPDLAFNGTQLDEVLEDHEFTADEVAPSMRQALPRTIEDALARQRGADRVFADWAPEWRRR